LEIKSVKSRPTASLIIQPENLGILAGDPHSPIGTLEEDGSDGGDRDFGGLVDGPMAAAIGADGAVGADPENAIAGFEKGRAIVGSADVLETEAFPSGAVELVCAPARTEINDPDIAAGKLKNARASGKNHAVAFVVERPLPQFFGGGIGVLDALGGEFQKHDFAGIGAEPDSTLTILVDFAEVGSIGLINVGARFSEERSGKEFDADERSNGIFIHLADAIGVGIKDVLRAFAAKDSPTRGSPKGTVMGHSETFDCAKGLAWTREEARPAAVAPAANTPSTAGVDGAVGPATQGVHTARKSFFRGVRGPLQAVIGPGAFGRAEPHFSVFALRDALKAKAAQFGENAPTPGFKHWVAQSRRKGLDCERTGFP